MFLRKFLLFVETPKHQKKLDPRLLDAREVFEELPDGPANNEAKVFNPEKKVRKREGYEEGDYLLYHTANIMDFVKTEDPIDMLGGLNKFTFDNEDHEWKILKKMDLTNKEFFSCIEDLKVLGRKDFKMILRWRKQARDLLDLDKEDDEVETVPLNEEEQIEKEMADLQEKTRLKNKREKRKKNETKQKEIGRMQMNMLTPHDIGIEAASLGRESLFNLKTAEKTGILSDLAKGKKRMVFTKDELAMDNDIYLEDGVLPDRDEYIDADNLENELDVMYDQYKERKIERDARFKAKQAREEADNWEGFEESKENVQEQKDYISDDDDDVDMDQGDSDDDEAINSLISKIKGKSGDKALSTKARVLFNDPIFDGVEADFNTSLKNTSPSSSQQAISKPKTNKASKKQEQSFSSDDDDESGDNDDFEIVANENDDDSEIDSDYDSEEDRKEDAKRDHAKDIEIATVRAMTLAHEIALGKKSKHDVADEGFNRYSFRDSDNVPEWFKEDEAEHSKINKPITKEAAMAIKEKLKALNARPIKKVAEAKARKKFRAANKLEKLKKKAGLINDDSDKSERDKADEITKLMKKVNKKAKTRPKVTLVVATGGNRGLSGRPKGVRGKYKMVDGVLKNEQRALRRIAKKNSKKRK